MTFKKRAIQRADRERRGEASRLIRAFSLRFAQGERGG